MNYFSLFFHLLVVDQLAYEILNQQVIVQMAARYRRIRLFVILRTKLTAGAPSISSIRRQFGLYSLLKTSCICVAVSNRVRNNSILRSSLISERSKL